MDLRELSTLAEHGEHLTRDQARTAADLLASAEAGAEEKADFLTALARKGEVASEVSGIAERFRELSRNPGLEAWQDKAIDVCGTGGDKVGSYNISTTVVFALAALGVPVFKHGNRSITSKCGSANLLEALGVPLMADDETLRRSLSELGFCFMFAPAFHPAFKEVMPVRQQLAAKGQRTVFNILGPLINPARPAYQLLGVYAPQVVPLMAETLGQLGVRSGLVVHCRLRDGRGMDELTVAGANEVQGFGRLAGFGGRFEPKAWGLAEAPVAELLGGELAENLALLDALLAGRAPKGLEDTVVANVAAALFLVGRAGSIEDGVAEARDALLGGKTSARIVQARDFFASL